MIFVFFQGRLFSCVQFLFPLLRLLLLGFVFIYDPVVSGVVFLLETLKIIMQLLIFKLQCFQLINQTNKPKSTIRIMIKICFSFFNLNIFFVILQLLMMILL